MISSMLVTRFDITMSRHVTTCHDMSRHVTTCHDMSRHVTTSRYEGASWRAATCYKNRCVILFILFILFNVRQRWGFSETVGDLSHWELQAASRERLSSRRAGAFQSEADAERTCSGQGVKASRRQGAKDSWGLCVFREIGHRLNKDYTWLD